MFFVLSAGLRAECLTACRCHPFKAIREPQAMEDRSKVQSWKEVLENFRRGCLSLPSRDRKKLGKEMERLSPELLGGCVVVPVSLLELHHNLLSKTLEFTNKQAKGSKEKAKAAYAEGRASRNPPERYAERNAEVIRLHLAGKTPSQIVLEIRKTEAWRNTERDTPFKAANVKSILQNARRTGRLRS